MATLLDTGLLSHFGIIFPFMLVFAATLVVLGYLNAFQNNKAIQAAIAISLAFLTLFSSVAVKTIIVMAPWFVLLFLVATFGTIFAMTIGYSPEHITKVLTGKEYGKMFGWLTMALILIVFLGSLSAVFSEEQGFVQLTQNTTAVASGEQAGFFAVLVHPQVLGMVLMLLIAVVTILKLTEG